MKTMHSFLLPLLTMSLLATTAISAELKRSSNDIKSGQLGEESTIQVLRSQLPQIDFDKVTRFECPVFIFAGAEDRTTPQTLAKEFFDRIQAPQKKFYKVEGAAHYVVSERPGIFLLDLARDIRPLSDGSR